MPPLTKWATGRVESMQTLLPRARHPPGARVQPAPSPPPLPLEFFAKGDGGWGELFWPRPRSLASPSCCDVARARVVRELSRFHLRIVIVDKSITIIRDFQNKKAGISVLEVVCLRQELSPEWRNLGQQDIESTARKPAFGAPVSFPSRKRCRSWAKFRHSGLNYFLKKLKIISSADENALY
eukprot:3722195-Pleurochrysis_carterae.AAC.1